MAAAFENEPKRPDRRGPHPSFRRVQAKATSRLRVQPLSQRFLCNTVGRRIGRIIKGCAAYRCAVCAARSRAATLNNLARASLALVLRELFGAAKSCAPVNLFMICPQWSAGDPSRRPHQILPRITAISWHLLDHHHACLHDADGRGECGRGESAARNSTVGPPTRPEPHATERSERSAHRNRSHEHRSPRCIFARRLRAWPGAAVVCGVAVRVSWAEFIRHLSLILLSYFRWPQLYPQLFPQD